MQAVSERPERPIAFAREILLGFLSPNVVAGVLLYLALAVFMGAFTTLKTMLPNLNAFWADPWLAELDRTLHFGHDPWRLLQPWLGGPVVTRLIELVYGPVWIGCLALIPLFFCTTRRHAEHGRRFLLAYLATWIISGVIVAGLFMSAGPAFYGNLTHDDAPFGDLVRGLDPDAGLAFSAAWQQRQLWAAYQSASSTLGAGISAFPSLHVSMITLCCLGMWKVSRPAAWALIGVAVVIALGSVRLGWHYAVDAYAGFGLTAAIWWASGRLARSADLARA